MCWPQHAKRLTPATAAGVLACMLQVCGLVGVLGRVPLHQQDILLPTSASSSSSQRQHQHHSRSSSAASLPTAAAADGDTAAGASSGSGMRPEGGRPLGDRARGVLAASATHLDRLVLGSARKLGRSITQDSLLRLFGSAGASLQVGEMRGNFFDFTRVEAVLDLGLNGPESLVQAPAAAAAGAAGKSSGGAGVDRNRTRAGAAAASKAAGSRGSSGGTAVRSASPARGMTTILGPAAAAAHAAAAAQPPLPPSAAGVVVGSSDGSPRSSTIGSNASGMGGHPRPTAGSSAPAAALPPTGAGAAAAAGGGSGVVGNSSSGGSGTGRHKHPAFALDERGVWHSLTLSATQQLFGPVRLRADARLALDSVHPCPRGAGEGLIKQGRSGER